MTDTSRIKIKFGEIEVEYEGTPEFLKEELPKLIKAVSELHQAAPPSVRHAPGGDGKNPGGLPRGGQLSVTTIAQKLSATTLPDLIIAAALSLTLRGSASFDKKDIRKEMRGAVGYWKAAMATNFDKTLARLAKTGRITHSGGDNYALPPTEHDALVTKLK